MEFFYSVPFNLPHLPTTFRAGDQLRADRRLGTFNNNEFPTAAMGPGCVKTQLTL